MEKSRIRKFRSERHWALRNAKADKSENPEATLVAQERRFWAQATNGDLAVEKTTAKKASKVKHLRGTRQNGVSLTPTKNMEVAASNLREYALKSWKKSANSAMVTYVVNAELARRAATAKRYAAAKRRSVVVADSIRVHGETISQKWNIVAPLYSRSVIV